MKINTKGEFALKATKKPDTFFIYNGEGTSVESVKGCFTALASMLQKKEESQESKKDKKVRLISAEEVIKGMWKENALAFLIPGGRDLLYCKRLNGAGNGQIKSFVEEGGTYIGICAGAYYASSYVEFDKGGPLEVLGERELGFFAGKAVGPVLSAYKYQSHEGARVAELAWHQGLARYHGVTWHKKAKLTGVYLSYFNAYFNGGCYFKSLDGPCNLNESNSPSHILGRYQNQGFNWLPAIVESDVGKGKAILSGVHPEYSAKFLASLARKKYPGWENLYTNVIPKIARTQRAQKFGLLKEILARI